MRWFSGMVAVFRELWIRSRIERDLRREADQRTYVALKPHEYVLTAEDVRRYGTRLP